MTDNVDPVRMERFLLRAQEMVPLPQLYVVPLAAGTGRYRLLVIYGSYATSAQANEASHLLPPKYQREFALSALSLQRLRSQL